MSREQTADKAALSLDMYMRAKCDIFLKRLESQMFAQVTHMINKVRSEIYSEVDKIADNFLEESSAAVENSSVGSEVFQASSISSSGHHASDGMGQLGGDSSDSLNLSTHVSHESDAHGQFSLPNRQRKKLKRREARRDPQPPEGVTGFSGMVPDLFIYRCSKDTHADLVKVHLERQGIKVKSVQLKSHENAATRSFKVCVESSDDFDKLLSRKFTPRYVKVKEYIYYTRPDRRGLTSSSRKSSYVNDPRDTVMSASCVSNEMTDQVFPWHVANVTQVTHHNRHQELYEKCKRDLNSSDMPTDLSWPSDIPMDFTRS